MSDDKTVILSHKICIKKCEELVELVRQNPSGEGWESGSAHVHWFLTNSARLFQAMKKERDDAEQQRAQREEGK